MRPPLGIRGRRPPDGSEVSFFKTTQSIKKWIEFSQISPFFLPKVSIFLLKFLKNWTYLTGISEFFRIFIWKLSNFMKPINPEKFSVNCIIWLRNLQWPLKGYQAPSAGDQGGKVFLDGSEVSFFKTSQSIWMQSIEKELIFQKCQHFHSQKIHFFKGKCRKIF